MIQALKSESPNAPSMATSQPFPAKDGRGAETFDPMLAMMVAQMLGSLQQAAPKGAATPVAPRSEPVPRTPQAPRTPGLVQTPETRRAPEAREPREPQEDGPRVADLAVERSRERAEETASERPDTPPPQGLPPEAEAPVEAGQPITPLPTVVAAPLTTLAPSESDVPEDGVQAPPQAPVGPVVSPEAKPAVEAAGVQTAPTEGKRPSEAPRTETTPAPRLSHTVVDERPSTLRNAELPAMPVPLDVPAPLRAAKNAESLPAAPLAPQATAPAPVAPPAPNPAAETAVGVAPPAPETAPATTEAPRQAHAPAPAALAAASPKVAAESRVAEARLAQAATPAPAASPTPVIPAVNAAQGREPGFLPSGQGRSEVRVQAAGTVQAFAPVATPEHSQAPSASTPVKATPHPVLAQVDGSIRWILRTKEQGADLQLHPESLGKVQIKLTVEGQQVHAQVWASEPSTVPILRENLAFLEVSLREQGLTLGNFQLHQGDRGQDAGFAHQTPRNTGSIGGLAPAESLQEVPLSVPAPLLGAYRIEVFA